MEHEITLISGWPGHGKTFFLYHYADYFKSVKRFHLDIFFEEYNIIEPFENFDIGNLLLSGKINKSLFLYIMKKNIIDDYILKNTNLFIEIACSGFVLNFILEDIKELFKKYNFNNINHYNMIEYSFTHDDILFNFGDFNIKQVDTNYINNGLKKLQQHEFDKIKHKITYQTFEEFDVFRGSNSLEKLKNCEYDFINFENKTFLDIGCNSGYFCFKASEKTNNTVVGIDVNEEFINSAKYLNRKVFKKYNIDFICDDIFSNNIKQKFDIIQCLSTYHYFSDNNKKEFFNIIHDLLNNEGLFILEVEENPDNKESLLIEKERPAGGIFSYPNEKWILDQITNKFEIIKKNKSCSQGGSLFERNIYIMKKI